jgi:CelD/BcsL family acetyltransferase involved in cellulose biosynthesis
MVQVETLRTLDALESLRDEWNVLADRAQSALLRHEWFASCARAFSADNDLRIVTVRRSHQLVGIAPLTLRRLYGAPRLELLGMSVLNEPSGFLAADEPALASLIDGVARLRTPLLLQRMAEDSPVPALLKQTLPWSSVLVQRPSAGCMFVPVTATWADYYKTLSSRITGNLRRVKARSNAVGSVSIAVLTPAESEVKELFDQIVQVEGSGWKGRRGSALAHNEPLRTFFEDYSRRAAREGILRVALLRFGDSVAAAELAVVAYRRWWQLKIGYAEEFAKHYPGLQLTEGTLRYAFDNSLDSFEFLGSPASWEANWRPETRRQCMAAVYPASVSGLHALSIDVYLMLRRRAAQFNHRAAPARQEPRP